MSKGIGLQLLCRADHLPDIFKTLQRIITALLTPFDRGHDLIFIGDIDAAIFIHPYPAKHLVVEDEEPVKFCFHIGGVTECDAMITYLGFQLESLLRGNIDLRDLGRPKAIAADKRAELQNADRQQAVLPCGLDL